MPNQRAALIVGPAIDGFPEYRNAGLGDFSGGDLTGKYPMLWDAFTIPGLLFLISIYNQQRKLPETVDQTISGSFP